MPRRLPLLAPTARHAADGQDEREDTSVSRASPRSDEPPSLEPSSPARQELDTLAGGAPPETGAASIAGPGEAVRDTRGRPLHDLRISVTDRCNFRCSYCMPREVFKAGFQFLPHAKILSFEEVTRLGRVFRDLGVSKFRLTGGEPLLRRDLPKLVEQLAGLDPHMDLALTTNGALLGRHARDLASAGLGRVTVSLDALDLGVFRAMNDTLVDVEEVLQGIEAARATGLHVKVNCVVRKGLNESQVLPLAAYFRQRQIPLRFIEFMDVGSTNGWEAFHVVSSRELHQRLSEHWQLVPLDAHYRGEVAQRFAYADGAGEVGFISSVTAPFCADCTRGRLSAEGRFFSCLFASEGLDLRAPLRAGHSDVQLHTLISQQWHSRSDAYSENRWGQQAPSGDSPAAAARPKIEMSYIGG